MVVDIGLFETTLRAASSNNGVKKSQSFGFRSTLRPLRAQNTRACGEMTLLLSLRGESDRRISDHPKLPIA
jgi:hypothetical protein